MIPVVWWNRNPAAIERGYWDQGIVEALLDGSLWPPARIPGCGHGSRDTMARNPVAGAVVVVPARHNVEHINRLNADLSQLSWCLLILTGDEEGAFPFEQLQLPERHAVWVMTPQPERDYGDATLIGSGWPPGIREALAEAPFYDRRPWAFMGQVTHERRKALVEMLHEREDRDLAWLVETPGFTQGQPQRDYWLELADAKVAPCPSGPCSPDSFRLYEALESGCVPIADNRDPSDKPDQDYWARVFGAHPIPTIESDWRLGSATIDWCLREWPRNANRIFAWWQRYKRALAWRFHDQLEQLSGQALVDQPLPITAVVTTSPSPKHPSVSDLETTIGSIEAQLPGCEIVLVFDGVAPSLEHRRDAYEEYVRRALWLANTRWSNVVPMVLEDWQHQAQATMRALDDVRTPWFLFVEHDTPLTGEIDWPGVVELMVAGEVDVLRLHHQTEVGPDHAHMMLEPFPREAPVPYVRTYQWSQRPHVAGVGWYRWMLTQHFAPSARTMIEDVMHGIVASAWRDFGLAGWSRYKLGIYHPEGNIQRSLHLDSRRLVMGDESTGDPKPPNIYVYPGEAPAGAPR